MIFFAITIETFRIDSMGNDLNFFFRNFKPLLNFLFGKNRNGNHPIRARSRLQKKGFYKHFFPSTSLKGKNKLVHIMDGNKPAACINGQKGNIKAWGPKNITFRNDSWQINLLSKRVK